jgi:hypothetical protein
MRVTLVQPGFIHTALSLLGHIVAQHSSNTSKRTNNSTEPTVNEQHLNNGTIMTHTSD